MKDKLLSFLGTLGVINEDQKLSITNIVVFVFVAITAVRGMFAGAVLSTQYFTWKIEGLDFSATLPLLFSLINYSHKRMALTNSNTESESK